MKKFLIVLLLAGAILLSGCTQNGTTGQVIGTANTTINANACNADSLCETNALSASKITVGKMILAYDSILSAKQIGAGLVAADSFYSTGSSSFANIKVVGNSAFAGKTIFYGDITSKQNLSTGRIDANRISADVFAPKIVLTSVDKNGTGYACIDPTGKIFKSYTPCK